MIIEKASINLQSGHYQQQMHRETERLEIRRNPSQSQTRPVESRDQLHLSGNAKAEHTQRNKLDLEDHLGAKDALAVQIIRRLVKEITGQELYLFSPDELQGQFDEVSYQEPVQAPSQTPRPSGEVGLVYQRSISYSETESTQFSAQGQIVSKDGKRIDFSVAMSMSRSFNFESNTRISIGEVAKTDPLVINFDGNAAELTDSFFEFDIDADGSLDQIATLKSNSGMLAVDKNQDGKINDGSELFGPQTGNGFEELAAYDEDHNNFIDEADSIYSRLRIWQRHADGSEQLLALGDKNIGAIYLGHVTTPFQLKTEDNTSLGEVASSGIYLTEQGMAGIIQQINFTV